MKKWFSIVCLGMCAQILYGWAYRIVNNSDVPIEYEIIYFTLWCTDDKGTLAPGENFVADPKECRLKRLEIALPSKKKYFSQTTSSAWYSYEGFPDPEFVVMPDAVHINRNVNIYAPLSIITVPLVDYHY